MASHKTVNLLQSLQSALQTSTLLLESTEGIFFFLVRTVIFAKDTRSVRDFAHAQCHDTDLDTDVNTVHSLGTDPRTCSHEELYTIHENLQYYSQFKATNDNRSSSCIINTYKTFFPTNTITFSPGSML